MTFTFNIISLFLFISSILNFFSFKATNSFSLIILFLDKESKIPQNHYQSQIFKGISSILYFL